MLNKKEKMHKSGYFMKVFLVLVSLGWVDPLADKVREGNELYHRGAYDEALDKYVNAQIESPQIPQLDFNIANTQYQRKKYDEAAQLFDKVVQSGNAEMQAKASFNMGNTLYRQGKMKEAMECYKKAVDFADELQYKGDESIDALKNDARYNYEYVERKIKENEQQQQQDQDKKDQQQKQENKDDEEDQHPKEDKDEEKEKQESQNDKQEPTPESTPKSDEQKKEHSQEPPDKDKQEDRRLEQPQPTQPQGQRQMSKEEAERFLDALNHAEKETRQMMRDKQRLQHKSVEKDW